MSSKSTLRDFISVLSPPKGTSATINSVLSSFGIDLKNKSAAKILDDADPSVASFAMKRKGDYFYLEQPLEAAPFTINGGTFHLALSPRWDTDCVSKHEDDDHNYSSYQIQPSTKLSDDILGFSDKSLDLQEAHGLMTDKSAARYLTFKYNRPAKHTKADGWSYDIKVPTMVTISQADTAE